MEREEYDPQVLVIRYVSECDAVTHAGPMKRSEGIDYMRILNFPEDLDLTYVETGRLVSWTG